MRDLMNTKAKFGTVRRRLLASASSVALFIAASGVVAEEADHPVVWLEFGGQLDRVQGNLERYAPHFVAVIPRPSFEIDSPLEIQNPTKYSSGGEGKISFSPESSEWMFSASIRYGRSSGQLHQNAQSKPPVCRTIVLGSLSTCQTGIVPTIDAIDAISRNAETHTILDFQAGKDIGIGLLGSGSNMRLNVGVRFVQMRSTSAVQFDEVPDLYAPNPFHFKYDKFHHHHYMLNAHGQHTFRGIGPSLSWEGTVPLDGNSEDGEVTFDWGLSAAALFGRQQANVHHRTTGLYYKSNNFLKYHFTSQYHNGGDPDRSRAIVVPNVGGFAGISFRYTDAKLSLGYRGDFFFGALDGGIDTRKSVTRGFSGPFASVSIGIGD